MAVLVLGLAALGPTRHAPAEEAGVPVGPVGSERAAIRADRPRVLVTPPSVVDVRQRCRTSHRAVYEQVRARVDAMLGSPLRLDWTGLAYLQAFAFMYQMTDEAKYAEKAGAMLDALSGGWPRDRALGAAALRAASLAYDWCWPALGAERRRRCARAMAEAARVIERQPRPSDFSSDLALTRLPLLWAGVALSGDEPVDDDARRWIEEGAALLRQHLLPASALMGADSGGHAEGFRYAGWGFVAPLAQAVELWRVASGENLFLEAPGLQFNAVWHVYCRRPFDGALERSEDCPSGRVWRQVDEGACMPLLAARYGDGLAQWVSRQVPREQAHLRWTEILWEDAGIAATPPAPDYFQGDAARGRAGGSSSPAEGLPLARLFPGLGHVAMRSGWSSREDTFALFQCGPFYAAHQHLDNNSFVIHKRRPLAIDSGVAESTAHRAQYASRTVAHNTVLVRDDAELFSDSVWGGPGEGGSNDGGQRRLSAPERVADVRPGSPCDVGRIIAYEHRPPYTYAAGDATRSYSAGKLESFVRQFVYIRPNLFIVFDRVAATRPEFEKRWLLHTLFEPQIDGKLVTVWDLGGTKFYCQTLLPGDAVVERIGGPGREFWVDGKNYPPAERRDAEAGEWRIEVKPGAPRREDVFLHVLYACERADEAMPAVNLLEEDERVGVRGWAGGIAYSVWFNRTGPVGGRVHLTRGREALVAGPLPDRVMQEPMSRVVEEWLRRRPVGRP